MKGNEESLKKPRHKQSPETSSNSFQHPLLKGGLSEEFCTRNNCGVFRLRYQRSKSIENSPGDFEKGCRELKVNVLLGDASTQRYEDTVAKIFQKYIINIASQ